VTDSAERVQALVIGGGVVGCALLRELAQRGIESLLVEAEPSLGEGTSKANSAIVHTGFDAHPGTIEASMLRRSAELWPSLVEELAVPFLEVGAVMIARDAEERERLGSEVVANAETLGVKVELLDRQELRRQAPYVTEAAEAAVAVPGESVIDPFWLTRSYAAAAIAAGARVWTEARVVALDVGDAAVIVGLLDGRVVRADQVYNAAGLWSDEVARLSGDAGFSLTPRRGQFLVSEETAGVERIVLPLPSRLGKGMLVTPIVFGGILLGPTAEDQDDKADRSTDGATRRRILEACGSLVPAVETLTPIRQFAGLRAVSSTGDYILRSSARGDRLYHVAGIRSTGISASPAIAEHVAVETIRSRGWQQTVRQGRSSVDPVADAAPGSIVCPCRWVSAAEVRASARATVPATTLDAAKRACGATFGDCQGNRCAVATAEVLAAELKVPVASLRKHQVGSWLFQDRSGGANADLGPSRSASAGAAVLDADRPWDLVVVGGGLAGIGVALAAAGAGLRPLVVERTTSWGGAMRAVEELDSPEEQMARRAFADALEKGRIVGLLSTTAAGLAADGTAWTVDLQDHRQGASIGARQVVLACGGYVEPREHREIAGPRGSGVATGDLVSAALEAGLLPGQVALVVGTGRYAEATARRMIAAGIRVHRAAEAPDELRGDRRLEAVRCGAEWLDVDLLVLADRLVAAPGLLRPLGLVDERVGGVAPTDPAGRCPLPGLWAAGTCRRPDVDHRTALEDGQLVGRALVSEVSPP
jgi:glycerol-3-phosphate dehydrogenase